MNRRFTRILPLALVSLLCIAPRCKQQGLEGRRPVDCRLMGSRRLDEGPVLAHAPVSEQIGGCVPLSFP